MSRLAIALLFLCCLAACHPAHGRNAWEPRYATCPSGKCVKPQAAARGVRVEYIRGAKVWRGPFGGLRIWAW